MRIALFSSNTSFFANEVTKSHTKKPRRNQKSGRRGQKSETIFIFYMTFSRQGRVEARFTLLFWLIEKVQCFDVKMLFLRSESGFFAVVKQHCYLDKRMKGKTILVEAAPISADFTIEYSRL